MIKPSRRPTHDPFRSGPKVKILHPPYAAGLIGTIVAPEEDGNGVHTGCWLIQVEHPEMILALTPDEIELLPS